MLSVLARLRSVRGRLRALAVSAVFVVAVGMQPGVGPTMQVGGLPQESDPRLEKLPAQLRERGRVILSEQSEFKRARLAAELAQHPASALEFLLSLLATDSSATVRRVIIDTLGRYSHPSVREALTRHAESDPDVRISILALERLHWQVTDDAKRLLTRRLDLARKSGDQAALRLLAEEHERYISLSRGTMLPGFLRVPPPIFSVKPQGSPIRVLAFGDFGVGNENQKQVAGAMGQYHAKKPFDFAITLGDNFYAFGMTSPTDPRWKTWWDELYNPLRVKFYATMGNHDWVLADSPAAEILYSRDSPSWTMPAPYYTFTAGPVQFFALDTNEISEAQLIWLEDQLHKSDARWKVVYGHHPIHSAGAHGDSPALISRLLPVLKGAADAYFAGHDHDLQHLKPEGGVHFFVSGGGGAGIRPVKPNARSLFARAAHGFAVIEAERDRLNVSLVGTDLAHLYDYSLTK